MSAPNYERPAFDPEVAKSLRKPTKLDRVLAKADAERDADAAWRACVKLVDLRDRRTCRCCGREGNPNATTVLGRIHRHHIVYRSAGGEDTAENVLSLCWLCHAAEHAGQLVIIGANANELIEFEVMEAAVVALFGTKELPKHCHIVLPTGERKVS